MSDWAAREGGDELPVGSSSSRKAVCCFSVANWLAGLLLTGWFAGGWEEGGMDRGRGSQPSTNPILPSSPSFPHLLSPIIHSPATVSPPSLPFTIRSLSSLFFSFPFVSFPPSSPFPILVKSIPFVRSFLPLFACFPHQPPPIPPNSTPIMRLLVGRWENQNFVRC